MLNFEFYRPTAYHFGAGTENKTGELVKSHGGTKVLIVYGGGSCVRSGLLGRVENSLTEAGVGFISCGGVVPNPRADLVYELIEKSRAEKVDFVLGVGGGSVIDTAKAVAAGVLYEGDFFERFKSRTPFTRALKVGVVLTIPAAGSEGSNSAVIQKEIDGITYKCGLGCPVFVPAFAVLNPELIATLPAYQTACGTVDMMTHIMERYFTNTPDVSVTDRMCEGLLCSVMESVQRVLKDPDNYGACANLMWAGTLAHNDICGVGREQDWGTHQMEHQLSAVYDVAHGAGLAVLFPAWMEYTLLHNVMRFAQFAVRVFGISMNFEDPAVTARAGIAALRNFYKSIGMPLSFSDIGAKVDDIPVMLKVLDADNKPLGHFVTLRSADCEAVYRIAAAYEG